MLILRSKEWWLHLRILEESGPKSLFYLLSYSTVLQPSSRDYDIGSHNTHEAYVDFIYKWRDIQFIYFVYFLRKSWKKYAS